MPRNVQSFLVDKMEYPGKPGAVQIVRHPDRPLVVGFNHSCPCGCGQWSFIRLNAEGWAPGAGQIWTLKSGDDLHMTLSPSIGIHPITNGSYHWHGYLRNGVFEEC